MNISQSHCVPTMDSKIHERTTLFCFPQPVGVYSDCRICVWNAADGSLVHCLTGHSESVTIL